MASVSESGLNQTTTRGYGMGILLAAIGLIMQYIAMNSAAHRTVDIIDAIKNPGQQNTDGAFYAMVAEVGSGLFMLALGMIFITFAVKQFSIYFSKAP